MSTEITHSLNKKSGTYRMLCGRIAIALVEKTEGGFRFKQIVMGMQVEVPGTFRTMAAVKEFLNEHLPQEVRNFVAPKEERISIEHAVHLCKFSHAEIRTLLNETRKIWPTLHHTKIGAYLVRMHMEDCSRWPQGEWARQWLKNNPDLGAYDRDEYVRRVEKIYGPQPEWCH